MQVDFAGIEKFANASIVMELELHAQMVKNGVFDHVNAREVVKKRFVVQTLHLISNRVASVFALWQHKRVQESSNGVIKSAHVLKNLNYHK